MFSNAIMRTATVLTFWIMAASANIKAEEAIQLQLTFAPEVPAPVGRSHSAHVVIHLNVVEKQGELSDGVIYPFWTYNGHVPGPFIRLRAGDTAEVHLTSDPNNKLTHNVDFHFATGPGGGAPFLMVDPGQERIATFKALHPGLYVYHCAAMPVPTHIANGLYGLVLVEPESGLPPVDREYYIMQSEFYTYGALGEPGFQAFSSQKAMAETPEYIVFNGHTSALQGDHALKARVGETVRFYVGNIGPNLISSFHMIGEIFDRVYREGSLINPEHNIQTTLIPAGGAATVEFKLEVPGEYTIVDHSIFRTNRGAVGSLHVDGPDAPEIYHGSQ